MCSAHRELVLDQNLTSTNTVDWNYGVYRQAKKNISIPLQNAQPVALQSVQEGTSLVSLNTCRNLSRNKVIAIAIATGHRLVGDAHKRNTRAQVAHCPRNI